MHAFLHKLRWEETGDWQDKLAWQGLAGIIGKDEIVALAHKLKGPAVSRAKMGKPSWNKGKRGIFTEETLEKIRAAHCTTHYRVTFPDGHTEILNNLISHKDRIPYRALINKLYLKKGTYMIATGPNAGWGIERVEPNAIS